MKDLKGNSLPFSTPAPASRRTPTKSPEQQVNIAPPTASLTEVSGSPVGAPEIVKSQDGEGMQSHLRGCTLAFLCPLFFFNYFFIVFSFSTVYVQIISLVAADGYSVYIKGLPYDATPALLENVFKKFGTIKNGGIQVRSKVSISLLIPIIL